jgi:hypothetical protein
LFIVKLCRNVPSGLETGASLVPNRFCSKIPKELAKIVPHTVPSAHLLTE